MTIVEMALLLGCAMLLWAALDAAELPEQHREPFAASFPIRQRQHEELDAYLDRLLATGPERRANDNENLFAFFAKHLE